MSAEKIKVLVVEDAHGGPPFLTGLLTLDPQISVTETTSGEQTTIDSMSRNKPDLILMDVQMPRVDAIRIIRRIMEASPVPIVTCSSLDNDLASRSLNAGAVAHLEKPRAQERLTGGALTAKMLRTVKAMSEVRVVRRWLRSYPARALPAPAFQIPKGAGSLQLVGIGASTGGPVALQIVLKGLSRNFPLPVLIVQHITNGFLPSMADWLAQTTGVPVSIASHGTVPLPGHAYLAPDDFHMGIGARRDILLSKAPPENGLRPSVGFLFRSLAAQCGTSAMGVLLTGMGQDGAVELKQIKDRGGITIAQDSVSSVIHGMPGAAIGMGAAVHVLPLDEIAGAMNDLIQNTKPKQ